MFRRAISFFALFLFLSLPFLVFAARSTADPDLVCHTSNQADCYPRVFEASTSFRALHDDQEIPKGLHVRLNLETGVKEAKLYDPREEAESSTVQATPGGGSVQLVPGEETVDEPVPRPSKAASLPATPQNPLQEAWKPLQNLYQKVLKSPSGPAKPPLNSDGDGTIFTDAVNALHDPAVPPAVALSHLAVLEDLTHDIYWGLTLAENAQAVQRLTQLLHSADPEVCGKAALVLGNGVRNNKGGLHAVLSYSFPSAGSAPEAETASVYDAVLARLGLSPGIPHGLSPAVYARLIYLLSSLLQSPAARASFAEANHTAALASDAHFAAAVAADSPGWNRPRAKIADLVLDHFADVEAFPSAELCPRPVTEVNAAKTGGGEEEEEGGAGSEATDDFVLVPSVAELEAHEACRVAADAAVLQDLRVWREEFNRVLSVWGRQGEHAPDQAIVDHVREARRGVGAALRGLKIDDFDYGVD